MKVLVTGATGFVGSWMTRFLVENSHQVRVLRRESSDTSEIDDIDVEHAIGDVTDADQVNEAAKGVDSIFHLAGLIGYSPSLRHRMERVNVQGTQNVLLAVQAHRIRRLVHMSSVVAIGASFDGTPLNENSSFNVHPLNLGYFETKLRAELLVRESVRQGLVDAVILNPSTIYGPGDAKKGSRQTQLKVARGKFPFYTSGGVNVVSVRDVVQAIYSAWKIGKTGERYILGADNITIKDLFEIIAKNAGVDPPSIFLPNGVVKSLGAMGSVLEKFGQKGPLNRESAWTAILYHWFDSSKAQKELGFQPRSSEESIRESVQWMKDNGYLS